MSLRVFGPNGTVQLGSSDSAVRINPTERGMLVESRQQRLLTVQDTNDSSQNCVHDSSSQQAASHAHSSHGAECVDPGIDTNTCNTSSPACPESKVFTKEVLFKNDVTAEQNVSVLGTVRCANIEQLSDVRLKRSICEMSDMLPKVCALKPVSYSFADGDNITHYGLIAQDVQRSMPDVVAVDDNGVMGIRYTELLAPMIGAIQELRNMNDALRNELRTFVERHST